jgi:hypothetical protein
MSAIESLAMFLFMHEHGMSNSEIYGIFNYSGETISRKFEEVLNSVVGMCENYIRPIDPNFRATHPKIANDRRMMLYFKDCIGALDGTHIAATPPPHDLITLLLLILTCDSHMHLLGNLDLCITLMCCFMH